MKDRLARILLLSIAACHSSSQANSSDGGNTSLIDSEVDDSDIDGPADISGGPVDVVQDIGSSGDTAIGKEAGIDVASSDAIDAFDSKADVSSDGTTADTTDGGTSECILSGGQCVPSETPQCSGITVCPKGTAKSDLRCEEGASCCLPVPSDEMIACADAGGTCVLNEGTCQLNCGQAVSNDCGPGSGGSSPPVCCIPTDACIRIPARVCILQHRCGPIPDGCGGTIECPACQAGQVCSDAGVCNLQNAVE
jgi:hypothetical protein